MTPALAAFSLWLHLAGAQPYGDGLTHATLARVRERSPNDHYECVRVK